MAERIESAAATGSRLATLSALVESLVEAIDLAPDVDVPALAARLLDVLQRIGGSDPAVLVWLRHGLAVTVDRLLSLQGETDEKGLPITEAKALAPMVRQLVAVVEALSSMPAAQKMMPEGVVTIDEAKRRRQARQSGAATSSGTA